MTRPSSAHRAVADRGTTLVEVVIGLLLAAMAAGLLAQLMTTAAREAPGDRIEPDVGLALDAFARDAREATHVTVTVSGRRVTTLTFVADTATVDWTLVGTELRRGAGPRPTPRTMAVGLDDTSTFVLHGPGGTTIAADDATAVRWCTRLVELTLVGDDWTANRQSALRHEGAIGACP